ncbi:hypothetical protein GW889_01700 [Candidatus Berkelbacteria bacterium]|uniref:Uncharacterized protein n=1 Tax=Candidatus Berkelbacteria bacterium CG10_big_fil_rev_8_21_14_0_10_43_14 TaxID=1974515 RepID=A0A2M6R858_9BACT|nr:hypothetical protein [Candidatus Berkelbacteria bacterium]OIP07245.1 MAG: hypothetical protein AUK41_00135 [Candidatus Berkelbacteria bacterium CG2_30_43_20]PIS06788.1 MAG: hypothetical protein COT79_02730 [Candidatus Berkelbacteria bacterium CG10_big_fil_rev_8_21_14_0_10_43_14]PIU87127.1 MAG: hypothetical protein COS66_02545 [Candidatus Berkelbacteria bacterium CG06_land_8_20_14_3_00_43_10]
MKKNTKRGTAYIEILIATLIISAYAIPLYTWIGRIDGIQSKIEQRAVARSLLESAVATYRATPKDQRAPLTQTTPVSELPSGQIAVTVTENDSAQPSLLSYTATLTWQSVGGTQTMHIATYINNGG